MEKLIDFCNFLSEHVNISPSSVAKYESAVRVISKEMLNLGELYPLSRTFIRNFYRNIVHTILLSKKTHP